MVSYKALNTVPEFKSQHSKYEVLDLCWCGLDGFRLIISRSDMATIKKRWKMLLGGRIGFGFPLGFVNVEQGIETIHKEVDKRFL